MPRTPRTVPRTSRCLALCKDPWPSSKRCAKLNFAVSCRATFCRALTCAPYSQCFSSEEHLTKTLYTLLQGRWKAFVRKYQDLHLKRNHSFFDYWHLCLHHLLLPQCLMSMLRQPCQISPCLVSLFERQAQIHHCQGTRCLINWNCFPLALQIGPTGKNL